MTFGAIVIPGTMVKCVNMKASACIIRVGTTVPARKTKMNLLASALQAGPV